MGSFNFCYKSPPTLPDMLELTLLLELLTPVLETNVGIMSEMLKGTYRISCGGVTMKNIARWTGKGGSYRNIQRFFSTPMDWLALNVLLFQLCYLSKPDAERAERYMLAFDEVVEDKAGKKTHGINWFYSSIVGKVIRAVSYHVVSIVDTQRKESFVLNHHQTVKDEQEKPKKKRPKAKKKKRKQAKAVASEQQPTKRSAGRPKGSKNKQNVKEPGLLYKSFEFLLSTVVALLRTILPNLKYVLADGAYGNKTCCLIVREFDLELISKLNRNTGLYLPYKHTGPRKQGRPRKYGKKIDYQNIDKKYLVKTVKEDGILTQYYQINGVWTKKMPCLINVVIIVKTDLNTQKSSRVVLFSTDLGLSAEKIVRFYRLRFQIEFNFRDAKQYFGLADFKNTKPTQVNNAVGFAFFMDNISLVLIEMAKERWAEQEISIQDLKAWFRAEYYIQNILNTLKIPQKGILNQSEFQDILKIGAVNRRKSDKQAA